MEGILLKKKSLIITCILFIPLILSDSHGWAEDSNQTVFKVNNLSCGGCVSKINTKLKTLDGYIRMLANFDEGLVAVDHSKNLKDREISDAITSLGYPAKTASESEYDQHEPLSSESPGWKSPSDGFWDRILGILNR